MTRRDEYEDDFYSDLEEDLEINVDEEIEILLEDDEISPEEAGFWHGASGFYEEED